MALFGYSRPNSAKFQKQKLVQMLISYYPPTFFRHFECFVPTFGILVWVKVPISKVHFYCSRPKQISASTVLGFQATPTFFYFYTLPLNHRRPLAWELTWDSFFEIMAGDGCSLNLLKLYILKTKFLKNCIVDIKCWWYWEEKKKNLRYFKLFLKEDYLDIKV